MPDHYLDKARNCGRITKAYDQQTVDQMRADLRVLDAWVVEWEESIRIKAVATRLLNLDGIELREMQAALIAAKRKQKALAAQVWRIEAAKEKSQ